MRKIIRKSTGQRQRGNYFKGKGKKGCFLLREKRLRKLKAEKERNKNERGGKAFGGRGIFVRKGGSKKRGEKETIFERRSMSLVGREKSPESLEEVSLLFAV